MADKFYTTKFYILEFRPQGCSIAYERYLLKGYGSKLPYSVDPELFTCVVRIPEKAIIKKEGSELFYFINKQKERRYCGITSIDLLGEFTDEDAANLAFEVLDK